MRRVPLRVLPLLPVVESAMEIPCREPPDSSPPPFWPPPSCLPSAEGDDRRDAADPLYRPLSNFKASGDKVRIAPEHYSAVRVNLGAAPAPS